MKVDGLGDVVLDVYAHPEATVLDYQYSDPSDLTVMSVFAVPGTVESYPGIWIWQSRCLKFDKRFVSAIVIDVM